MLRRPAAERKRKRAVEKVADPHAAALRKISNTEAKKRQRKNKVSALRVHEGRDPTRRGGSVAERAGAVGEKRDRADCCREMWWCREIVGERGSEKEACRERLQSEAVEISSTSGECM